MYQALYRKWRPQSFADVVGQEHITRTLKRQVAEGRLSHAYLFTGTRGTGKTTCAKILAKAVNCLHPVDGDPCNQCEACLGIDNGSFLDVLELDAASNNGVDHVRALRDDAIYAPAQVKYRVYIIDEVHMLSVAAFNALLKILEEPPEHLLFILATTELHKVPATILSRCQRFAFKRILPGDIANRLLTVARAESIDLTPGGASVLARLSDGALRDGLSLLDQCAAAGGTVDENRIFEILGLAGGLQTAELMEHLLRRDQESALLLLHQLYSGGKDVTALLNELSTLARDLLISMTAPTGGEALLSGGYDEETLSSLRSLAKPQRILHMTDLLQQTTAALPLSVNRRTDAELCLLKLCDDSLCGDLTALVSRIERLEKEGVAVKTAAPVQEAPAKKDAPAKKAAPVTKPAPEVQAESKAERKPVEKPPVDDLPWEEPPLPEEPPVYGDVPQMTEKIPQAAKEVPVEAAQKAPAYSGSAIWQKLFSAYKSRLPGMYRAFLDDAAGTLDGGILTVVCGSDFTKQQLSHDKVTSVLSAVTAEAVGQPIRVVFSVGETEELATPSPVSVEDNFKALLDAGSQFEQFTVK